MCIRDRNSRTQFDLFATSPFESQLTPVRVCLLCALVLVCAQTPRPPRRRRARSCSRHWPRWASRCCLSPSSASRPWSRRRRRPSKWRFGKGRKRTGQNSPRRKQQAERSERRRNMQRALWPFALFTLFPPHLWCSCSFPPQSILSLSCSLSPPCASCAFVVVIGCWFLRRRTTGCWGCGSGGLRLHRR